MRQVACAVPPSPSTPAACVPARRDNAPTHNPKHSPCVSLKCADLQQLSPSTPACVCRCVAQGEGGAAAAAQLFGEFVSASEFLQEATLLASQVEGEQGDLAAAIAAAVEGGAGEDALAEARRVYAGRARSLGKVQEALALARRVAGV